MSQDQMFSLGLITASVFWGLYALLLKRLRYRRTPYEPGWWENPQ